MSLLGLARRRVRATLLLATMIVVGIGATAIATADGYSIPGAPTIRSLTISPRSATVGSTVSFAADATDPAGGGLSYLWDFGDGTSSSGPTPRHVYKTPDSYLVQLTVEDNTHAKATRFAALTVRLIVGNKPPVAAFTFSPGHPRTGQRIVLISLAHDPDGPISGLRWDLDGDGRFQNGTREVEHVKFKKAGKHRVGLQVLDAVGASSVRYTTIRVTRRPYSLLNPFPTVEISAILGARSARVEILSIKAPRGSRVSVSCLGRGCPRRRWSVLSRSGRPVRASAFQRRLRAGTRLIVKVTKAGRIGKYTSFLIRSHSKAPRRRDLCLIPGRSKPVRCP